MYWSVSEWSGLYCNVLGRRKSGMYWSVPDREEEWNEVECTRTYRNVKMKSEKPSCLLTVKRTRVQSTIRHRPS